jgi:uncharacterized protein (TIGR01777 family)
MIITVSGASGMIGRALVPSLTASGHEVRRLVRRTPGPGEVRWDPAGNAIDAAGLAGVDAVVHLAGENIAAGRWTSARKARIRESRVGGTGLLARTVATLDPRPRVLVSASAMGIYGDRGDERLPDGASPGRGFLATLGQAWEAATEPARAAGIRVAFPRTGLVLHPDAGALARMLPPFRLGVGGPLGTGRQWMSWVTLDDLIAILHHLLLRDDLAGPFNATAPGAVTNAEFTRQLGAAVGRPAVIPVPAPLLSLLFGEMAHEALLASLRVEPTRLLASGFVFRDSELGLALQRLLRR